MTRKPPAELHPSKQKPVQGRLKISLEGSPHGGKEEAAAADPKPKRAAATIAEGISRPRPASAATDVSEPVTAGNSAQATDKNSAAATRLGRGMVRAQRPTDDDRAGKNVARANNTVGGASSQQPRRNKAQEAELMGSRVVAHEEEELAGSRIAHEAEPMGSRTAHEAGLGSRMAVAGEIIRGEKEEEEEERWEGVAWDEEDEALEADSLGTVSASLGTMEVASLHEENSQDGPRVPEPQDLLIRVMGVDDIREVREGGFNNSRVYYCM